MSAHVHVWVNTVVGCEDCGDHDGVRCDTEEPCPTVEAQRNSRGWVDENTLDLVFADDPRDP